MGSLGPLEALIILAVILALALIPVVLFWRIFSKAGFPGALGLIALIPTVGILVLLIVLAISEWPIERDLRGARQGEYA